jgi:TetR/AcrR family transcriptional regulator
MVKEKKDQNTEQKILNAARAIFMEKGMDGARMQDIADRAGMNKALLHYYFRNKEKLFETVFTEAAANFLSNIVIITTTDTPLFHKIEKFVEAYINMLTNHPFLPLFILNEVNKQDKTFIAKIWGNKKPPIQMFLKQVEDEVKKGTIKPIEPFQLMINMVSMCIFPFVARPMIQWVHGMTDDAYWQFIEKRKTEVSKFIIDSIRK